MDELDEPLVSEDDLRQSYLAFKRAAKEATSCYQKMTSSNYSKEQLKQNYSKIQNTIKQYEKNLELLLKKMENSNDSQSLNTINTNLEKTREETDNIIETMKESLEQVKTDMNVEMEDQEGKNYDEYNNNDGEKQELKQEEANLFEAKEYLDKRGEEIQGIHKIAAVVKDTTEKMKTDLANQGEMLDNIEEKINVVSDNVQEAGKEINKANEYSKGNNKRLSCIVGIVVIAVGVVLAIVLSVVLK